MAWPGALRNLIGTQGEAFPRILCSRNWYGVPLPMANGSHDCATAPYGLGESRWRDLAAFCSVRSETVRR